MKTKFKTIVEYAKACNAYNKSKKVIDDFRSSLLGKKVLRKKTFKYPDGRIIVTPGEVVGESTYYMRMWKTLKKIVEDGRLRKASKKKMMAVMNSLENNEKFHGIRRKKPSIIAELRPTDKDK